MKTKEPPVARTLGFGVGGLPTSSGESRGPQNRGSALPDSECGSALIRSTNLRCDTASLGRASAGRLRHGGHRGLPHCVVFPHLLFVAMHTTAQERYNACPRPIDGATLCATRDRESER